jgi:hypothetical protein
LTIKLTPRRSQSMFLPPYANLTCKSAKIILKTLN